MLFGYKIAAVCISRVHEDVLRECIEAFSRKLAENGWRALIFSTGSDLYYNTPSIVGQATIFDLINPAVTDAVVIFGDKILDPDCLERIMSRAASHDVPVILLNGRHKDACCLNFDFENGFAQVVRHLAEVHKVRDFHFIAGMENNDFSDTRIEVMRQVLAEFDIPFTKEHHVSYGDFWSEPARAAVRRLIQENRVPRAIVCANDSMAIAVIAELQDHGYCIPEDVIVTGFDGIDEIYFSTPKVTSATCDYRKLGEHAAQLCIASGNGETLPEYVEILPEFLAQESCGCVHKHEIDMVESVININNVFNRFINETERLSEVSAHVQGCNTLEEVSQQLHVSILYCMQCMIKKECTDFTLDPMVQHSASTFGEEMYILLDTDWPCNEGSFIKTSQLSSRMEELLQSGAPIIFAALHHVELPIGYFCYTYQTFEHANFLKINQNTMFIGPAIQGFRNRHYQEHLQAMVEEMYRFDSLTGLLNRSAFIKRFNEMITTEKHDIITLVIVDLDGLKYINDFYSHSEGDNAIATVASALHEVCRGLCCRYGGDEMIAVLMREADPAAIRTGINTYLANYNANSNKPYKVSASVGVYSSRTENFETMFEKADALMYQDKMQKPNRRQ